MTHPFHPLHGQVLEVVDRRRCEDGEVVYLEVAADRIARLPASWTSLAPADPWRVVAAGRALFRVADLERLAALLEGLAAGGHASDGV